MDDPATMPPITADVAIIGGGSAGVLLAARLSAEPDRQVVLIEAGPEARDPDIWHPAAWPALQGRSYDWDYRTLPQPGTNGRVHRWARGKLVGGSSCLHAMGYMRGHPDDFRAWAEAAGDARWRWEGLLPAFRANEGGPDTGAGTGAGTGADTGTGAGTGGALPLHHPREELSPLTNAFIETGATLGLPRLPDHNDGRMTGVTPNTLNIRDGRRVTVADAWLTPDVRARANLRLVTETRVRRLLLDGPRVTRIAAIGLRGPVEMVADEVILSAGALESPALLMRSGIGPADVLAAASVDCRIDLPGVGRNLQDHLLGAGNVYTTRRPLPPSRLQHSEAMAYMRAGDFRATGRPEIVVGCGVAPIVSERFGAPEAGHAYSLLFGVTHPTSRGDLRITGPEPDDRPRIDPAYLKTENDRAMMRAALAAAREMGHADAMAEWRGRELYPGGLKTRAEVDAFIAEAVITHHHPCGTCRMGRDAGAVVDADLRLRGVDNLHVVDASVMPSLTAGPIHAAVLAIAETFARMMTGVR